MKKTNEKNVNNKQKNKNNVKKKKDDIKSSIDSPFSLNFPSIDYGDYSQIVSCLKKTFGSYLTAIKKDNKFGANTESTSSKDFKNLTKKLLSQANPTYLIFGFNSVMRGLEKGSIKTVFVNANTTPNMLIKSFIPICNLKSIPLIPVKNLSDIFANEIRIKSTLVVGFTSPACVKDGPFHNLYISSCKVLGLDDCKENLCNKSISELKDKSISEHKDNKSISEHKDKQNQLEIKKKTKVNLISSYHLKRKNNSSRMFEPPKRENTFEIMSFIKLDKSEPPKPSTSNYVQKLNNKRKSNLAFKEKSTHESKRTLHETSELSFFIDVNKDSELEDKEENDIHLEEEEEKEENTVYDDKHVQNKRSTARYFEALNSADKSGLKRKSHYLPAKIKKVKANSKRHL